MEGYHKNGTPNVNWWDEQLRAGVKFRKRHAHENKWDRWRDYYRGRWRHGILPKNLFFMLTRSMVPRIYFRNPSVSITPLKPGPLHAALAKIQERVDNKLLLQMGVKEEMKKIVMDAHQFGTGFGKLGFGAQFTPTPNELGTEAPVTRKGYNVEHRAGVLPDMPWFARAHTGTIIVPAGCMDFKDAAWVAHVLPRPMDLVRDDTRLSHRKDIKPGKLDPNRSDRHEEDRKIDMVELVEIRDMRTGKVFILAPQSVPKALLMSDDELQTPFGPPIFPVSFNPDDSVFWGIPDYQILEPYQLEINETNTQIMHHRRAAMVKLLYEDGAIEKDQIDNMMSPDVGAAVKVKGSLSKVLPLQIGAIPQDLLLNAQTVMQDVRETLGFSRNQFGEFSAGSGDRTATEANIVRQASEIRLDERRDMMADMLTHIVHDMHGIIYRHWGQEQVIDVLGPGGVPMWVAFTSEMLRMGQYEIKVDPDTSVPETKQLREQRSQNIYQLFRTNPLVDPVKLTQYLLREHHGTAFDDMIRADIPGANPQNPMQIEQFAALFNEGHPLQIGGGSVA